MTGAWARACADGTENHRWRPKHLGTFRGEPVYTTACSTCGLRRHTYQAIIKEQGDQK